MIKKLFVLCVLTFLVLMMVTASRVRGPAGRLDGPARPARVADHLDPVPVAAKSKPAVDPWARWRTSDMERKIEQAGKDDILRRLKHPLDAAFPWFGVSTTFFPPMMDGFPGHYYVAGTVRAKNDFGADLTSSFKVTFECADDTYTTCEVLLDGQVIYRDADLDRRDARRLAEADAELLKERGEFKRRAAEKAKADRETERRKFAREHPEEAGRREFGPALTNAKSLIKARIYPAARTTLKRIIDGAPGTTIAAEAQKELDGIAAR
jgi:hypothetical protein